MLKASTPSPATPQGNIRCDAPKQSDPLEISPPLPLADSSPPTDTFRHRHGSESDILGTSWNAQQWVFFGPED